RGAGPAIIECRTHPDLDARQSRGRLDAAEDLRRIEHALEALEARHEIGDAHRVASTVANGGLHNRRVAQILALRGDRPLQHHVAEALLHIAGEEPRQDRVRVKAREAPPRDPSFGVHQSRASAVADDRKVEGPGLWTIKRHLEPPRAFCKGPAWAAP